MIADSQTNIAKIIAKQPQKNKGIFLRLFLLTIFFKNQE